MSPFLFLPEKHVALLQHGSALPMAGRRRCTTDLELL
jgi:hypothetical protein